MSSTWVEKIQAIIDDLDNGTDGLGALKTLIDTVNTDLANGTDGLGALKALINAIPTTMVGTNGAALAASWTAALATALANYTATRAGYLDTLNTGVPVGSRTSAFSRLAGVAQITLTTIALNQAAASYDLFTGTTQDVWLESLIIRLPNVDVSDDSAITGITIQIDDVTAIPIITTAQGLKVNLTAEAQLASKTPIYIKAGTKIQLTIVGGASDAATVCDVVVQSRAIVDGGYLA